MDVGSWLEGLGQDQPLALGAIRVVILVGAILTLVPGLIWLERRLLSWMQDRVGPNRTGTVTFPSNFPIKFLAGRKVRTFGLLQPIADGVKLFLKEDITPKAADKLVYFLAPFLALFPAFAIGGTLPWASTGAMPFSQVVGPYALLTPVADVEIGLLYVLAISSLGAYGLVLAGYASNNKYSLMGGLRASAQLISYELGMGVSLACVALAAGSLRMSQIVAEQEQPLWGVAPALQNWFLFTPWGLVSAVVFLICVVAETNRAPFDLPEAENELIAGYHTEYSSMKFAVFFMGEYAAMFLLSGVFAAVFLGGYNLLPVNWEHLAGQFPAMSGVFGTMASLNYWLGPLFFVGKCAGGIAFFIWLRATLPRLRYDQLMSLGWKTLLPLAVANFIVVGIYIIFTSLYGPAGGWAAWAGATLLLVLLYLNIAATTNRGPLAGPKRQVRMVSGAGPKEPKPEEAAT
jgi:NADH-quinone oxidoreductase subunit H